MRDGVGPDSSGHRRRLRERFLRVGLDGFADHEALELLLTLAIPRRDVKPHAKRLLREFGSLRGVLDADQEALLAVDGIGEASVTVLRIVRVVAEAYVREGLEKLANTIAYKDMARLWQMRIGSLPNEVFEVAYLDSRQCLLPCGFERLSEGTLDRAAVYSRRVMEAAVKRKATSLVFAHNHPNGDPTPTEQDKLLTQSLVLAAKALEITVHDHLIIARDGFFSFRKEGLL